MPATTLAVQALPVEALSLIALAIVAFVFVVLAGLLLARTTQPFELRCGPFSLRWGGAPDDTS
jgi:hypothetical protein